MANASAEVIKLLDPYVELKASITAHKLQGSLSEFAIAVRGLRPPYRSKRTTNGRRISIVHTSNKADAATLAHPFEWTQKRERGGTILSPFDTRVTSLRSLDPKKVAIARTHHDPSWLDPMPTNVSFANGREFYETGHPDLWAVFEPNPSELPRVEAGSVQIIEPKSPHARILGYITSYVQEGLNELLAADVSAQAR